MATGSFMTPIYSRSQSEVQGDLHKSTSKSFKYFSLVRPLCSQTVPDGFPIPHLHDFAYNPYSKRIFSTTNLVRAYQILVADDDVPKTADAGRRAVLLDRWIVRSEPLEIVGSSGHEKVPTRGKPGLEQPGRPRGEKMEGSCGKHLWTPQ
ncbi:hypothetical protein TNCV_4900361 [Trichonephila clavipes]|nr:hypothetical protein TNCV_4900361 [Trichonephila clavipes]